jgi:hypothetical protein
MDTLRFVGVVAKGCGKFSVQLRLPTKGGLSVPIRDWPEVAAAGTLNVHVARSGFPLEHLSKFQEPSFRHLDSRRFAPVGNVQQNVGPSIREILNLGLRRSAEKIPLTQPKTNVTKKRPMAVTPWLSFNHLAIAEYVSWRISNIETTVI